MAKNLWPGDFTNIMSIEELAKRGVTTVSGQLFCDSCGPQKMTINIAEAHNELARFITQSYSKLNQKAPLMWKKVELPFYCTRCGIRYFSANPGPRYRPVSPPPMNDPPMNENEGNFHSLYLIEASGSLKLKHPSPRYRPVSPPPMNDNEVNFPFLYLIEALGSLKPKHLKNYCKQNHLRPKTNKDGLLYQVYYHIGTRFEGGELRPAPDDDAKTDASSVASPCL